VDEKIVVELKVAKEYNPKDEPQLLNELKAQERKVAYSSIPEPVRNRFRKKKSRIQTPHLLTKSVFYQCESVAKDIHGAILPTLIDIEP